MFTTRYTLARRLFQLSLLTLPCTLQAETIDLLVLYDTKTFNHYSGSPQTAIRNMVAQVNTFYQNSDVDLQLRLVDTMLNNPTGADTGAVITNVRSSTEVTKKRDEVGADFVTQFYMPLSSCGIGYVAIRADHAYNMVKHSCGAMTLAHELGHNMGLNHSRRQGNTGGVRYAYGLGHGVDSLFATIMAYPQSYGTSRIGMFSNPRLTCKGVPCGVPEGEPEQADAAKALNNVRAELAAFRPTKSAPTDPVTITNGAYLVKAKHSGKCVDVAARSMDDRGNVSQWSCHGATNQVWTLTKNTEGWFEFKAKHSGKCMDVAVKAGNVQQWTCHKGVNQQWKPVSNGDGTYRLEARVNGKVVEVAGGSTDNAANIQPGDWASAGYQSWTFEPVL